jgi:hypothetical protein
MQNMLPMPLPISLKKLFSCLLLLPLTAAAQDITGLWRGTLYNDTTKETLRFEVGISEEKGKLTGFSHTFIQHEDKLYYAIKKIKVKKKEGKVVIEDVGLIFNSSPLIPPKGVNKTCVLDLEMADSLMVLSGPFATNRTREYHVLTGQVRLQRKNDYYQSDLLARLDELKLANETNFAPMAYRAQAAQAAALQSNPLAVAETPEPVLPNLGRNNMAATPAAAAPPPGTVAAPAIKGNQAVAVDSMLADLSNNGPDLQKISGAATTVAVAPPARTAAIPAIQGNQAVAVDSMLADLSNNGPDLQKINGAAAVTANRPATSPSAPATIAGGNTVPIVVAKPVMRFDPAAEVGDRITEMLETVSIDSDSLQLTLYDNGEVDGDTVSVLLNGQVILPKQGLSTKAVRKTIYLPPGTETVQLLMYAENLGSIPPNTGLLVVHDGDKVYEIRFSADMKKNAAIVFRRKR